MMFLSKKKKGFRHRCLRSLEFHHSSILNIMNLVLYLTVCSIGPYGRTIFLIPQKVSSKQYVFIEDISERYYKYKKCFEKDILSLPKTSLLKDVFQ